MRSPVDMAANLIRTHFQALAKQHASITWLSVNLSSRRHKGDQNLSPLWLNGSNRLKILLLLIPERTIEETHLSAIRSERKYPTRQPNTYCGHNSGIPSHQLQGMIDGWMGVLAGLKKTTARKRMLQVEYAITNEKPRRKTTEYVNGPIRQSGAPSAEAKTIAQAPTSLSICV
jgi:hypothetical protein